MSVDSFETFHDRRFAPLLSKARKTLPRRVADEVDVFVDEILNERQIALRIGRTKAVDAVAKRLAHGLFT